MLQVGIFLVIVVVILFPSLTVSVDCVEVYEVHSFRFLSILAEGMYGEKTVQPLIMANAESVNSCRRIMILSLNDVVHLRLA